MITLRGVQNQKERDVWVANAMASCDLQGKKLIDVGAGQQPYRNLVEAGGGLYFSHDFNSYSPSESEGGLHGEWPHLEHNYVCDILKIPEETAFDFVLCTEVLEHVPDPVAALDKLSRLLVPGGVIIITVPRMSLIHQAPFHFATGLSEFFFKHWTVQLGLEVLEICLHGDYADLQSQEFRRILRLPGIFQVPINWLIRTLLTTSTLTSGGFSIFLRLKKRV